MQTYANSENFIANYSKLIAKSCKSLESVALSGGATVKLAPPHEKMNSGKTKGMQILKIA